MAGDLSAQGVALAAASRPYRHRAHAMTTEDEIANIKSRHYECFIEDHESKPWTPGQCAGFAGRTLHLMRCQRRDGHGVGGLFCRQHAQIHDRYARSKATQQGTPTP